MTRGGWCIIKVFDKTALNPEWGAASHRFEVRPHPQDACVVSGTGGSKVH